MGAKVYITNIVFTKTTPISNVVSIVSSTRWDIYHNEDEATGRAVKILTAQYPQAEGWAMLSVKTEVVRNQTIIVAYNELDGFEKLGDLTPRSSGEGD